MTDDFEMTPQRTHPRQPSNQVADAVVDMNGIDEDLEKNLSCTEEDRERRRKAEQRNAQMAFEKHWKTRKDYFTPEQREKAWDTTARAVRRYSDKIVERWNKEIDTLLVYAGLFSAILTAFNVQSYQLLTPSGPDPVVTALQQISAQLSSFSVNPNFVNATHPAFILHQSDPLPAPRSAIWLNTLWFSSLIFSLSAASVGIMVKQWLNEYNSGISGNSRQLARLRQHRLNALMKWRVAEIVAVLPVLLQVASGLFFAGLLVLLWGLDNVVAIVATVLIGLLVVFSLTTMALPAFTSDCSYLSPPARAAFEIVRPLKRAFYTCCRRIVDVLDWLEDRIPTDTPTFLSRLTSSLLKVEDSSRVTLRGKELSLVSSWTGHLDADIISMAYTTTMNPHHLDDAAICFTDLSPGTATLSAQRILTQNLKQWGPDRHTSMMRSVRPCMWSGVMAAMLARAGQGLYSSVETNSGINDDLWTAYQYIYWMPGLGAAAQTKDGNAAALRVLCMDFVNIILHTEVCELPRGSAGPPMYVLEELSNLLAHQQVVLGTDVRLSVAVHLEAFVQRRVRNMRFCGEKFYPGWYSLLRCLVSCVPKPPSQDHKPGDESYEAARACARRGLQAFAQLLVHQALWDVAREEMSTTQQIRDKLNSIFYLLRTSAQPVDLISPELVQGMAHYLHGYERICGAYKWEEQREWILQLEGDLLASEPQVQISDAALNRPSTHVSINTPGSISSTKPTSDTDEPPMLLSPQTSSIPDDHVLPGSLAWHTVVDPSSDSRSDDGARTETPPPELLSA